MRIFQKKISYLGFDIDRTGLHRNKDRIRSVFNAPKPNNVSELRAFIGMVNHHSKFIQNFAKEMHPLYNLLQKDVEYEWSAECQKAFELMKTEICSDKVLVHFNPKLPIILTTDACNTAIAGILSHKFEDGSKRPIAYVSRALNKAELNYSTIEKEALAIVFSVTKLRQYLLGTHFKLLTDHRPLVTIFGEHKGIPVMAAARMQRWAFILSGFNYSIEYVKGSLNSADALSRIAQSETNMQEEGASYINYVDSNNPIQLSYKDVAIHTRRDPVLSKLHDCIQNGTVEKLIGEEFSAYRSKNLELTVESGCILWGYRTVIPNKLRKTVLQDLHISHMGIVKTKALARSYVYWPSIDKDIETLIRGCEACNLSQASPEKSALIPWKPADSAWKRIHVDYASINGTNLLIIVDSYSKWVEVFSTKVITSAFTISKLREVFCRFGIPDIIVSDNGTQFTSAEFKEFLRVNGIEQKLTAPGNPSTNGQAENSVKTVKKSLIAMIKNCKRQNIDLMLNRFLMDYRITKHCTTNETPAKILLGHEIKSRFNLLKPPVTHEIIEQKQQTAIKNFKGKRDVKFSVGQRVYVRNYKNPNKANWSQAKIKKVLGPRNYTCYLLREKREIKRHVDQIRDTLQPENEGDSEIENDNENIGSAEESIALEPRTEEASIISIGSSDGNDDSHAHSESDRNDSDENDISVPDVVERPSVRSAAAAATSMITNTYRQWSRRQ